ncbi:MAG: hypothetical protein HYS27_01110 [Deltaproteobacteria bacterium]|nr:hypothetical protein [Deltaproteobacteria bacterium]
MKTLTLLALLAAFLTLGCDKEPSTGPFHSILALERWHRTDPAREVTMTGLVTFHVDDRLPSWLDVDESCRVQHGNWDDSSFRPPSFGTIRMSVNGKEEETWTEDSQGIGWGAPDGTLAWDSGDSIRVTAEGDEAPGFEVEATMPQQVVLTSHDLAALSANEMHLDRSVPLELEWTATDGEVLLLFLQFDALNDMRKQRWIWCTWPAADGAATVPTTVLEHLVASHLLLSSNIYFGGVETQQLALEGLDLDVFTFKNEVARIQVD